MVIFVCECVIVWLSWGHCWQQWPPCVLCIILHPISCTFPDFVKSFLATMQTFKLFTLQKHGRSCGVLVFVYLPWSRPPLNGPLFWCVTGFNWSPQDKSDHFSGFGMQARTCDLLSRYFILVGTFCHCCCWPMGSALWDTKPKSTQFLTSL